MTRAMARASRKDRSPLFHTTNTKCADTCCVRVDRSSQSHDERLVRVSQLPRVRTFVEEHVCMTWHHITPYDIV
jgi:hypothetical protein